MLTELKEREQVQYCVLGKVQPEKTASFIPLYHFHIFFFHPVYVFNRLVIFSAVHSEHEITKRAYKLVKCVLTVFPSNISNQEKCFQYWPSEGSIAFGDYTVELTGDTQCETFTLKDMVVTYRPVSNVVFFFFFFYISKN